MLGQQLNPVWSGLANYASLAQDGRFLNSLSRSACDVRGCVRLWLPRLGAGLRERLTGGPYTLGIRPIDVGLGRASPESTMRGEIVLRERLGDHDRFIVDCDGETILAEAPPTAPGAAGETIGLVFPPERVHLFDRTTGRNLAFVQTAAPSAA